ncbi:Chromosome-partitioning protein Spo0J [Aquisphaera giovannonii]|uniref:Chromosome-partitioning protein Spo0J n=1 Tax=Aquisphaera giovannonii TaxID=406548 RepID=A0A5B9W7D1_9BACT|nr:ParB/RepB/Spo0J family partition protein [Aquisphaera giovannonii]QEH36586.1 Chromosome-partitioning protein Spo0J [Aquisphaera giovannonii]
MKNPKQIDSMGKLPGIREIEISKLEKSPLNARKTVSEAACDEMKASILTHGLLQNLVVTEGKKGKYLVIAGARRLEALKALQAEGHLPEDFAVPCRVELEEQAYEKSLAENVVRLAMHPADQFEAFAKLIELGQTAEQVATRFGITPRLVEQRMTLARVAPELIAAYRAEELTLDALMAFAVTDDHQKQISVYESLNDWQLKRPGEIRSILTEQLVEAEDKLVKFVGMNTYLDAGGTKRTDLFGEEVYLENPELLNALVSEKLKLAEKELQAEGWGWVQVDQEHDWRVTSGCSRLEAEPVDAPEELMAELKRLEEEQLAVGEQIDATEDEEELDRLNKRNDELDGLLDDLANQIAAYAKFDPEQMKLAGCYAYISHSGTFTVERGLVKREAKKALAKAAATHLDDDQPAEQPKGMPESLKRDLAAYRLGAAQVAIATNPAIAYDLLVFKVAKNALTMQGPSDGPNVSFSREFALYTGKDARDFLKAQIEPAAEDLPRGWLEAGTEADQFLAFQLLSDYQKQSLLAYCVAMTLQPKLDEGNQPTAYDVALAQTGVNVADHWRPTKDNFLSRVTKDHLLEVGRELIGGERGETWAAKNANEKKGDIASELQKAFSDPDRYGGTPEQIDRVKNWLPKGMAFMAAPEPKPAKAKKGKKAA